MVLSAGEDDAQSKGFASNGVGPVKESLKLLREMVQKDENLIYLILPFLPTPGDNCLENLNPMLQIVRSILRIVMIFFVSFSSITSHFNA